MQRATVLTAEYRTSLRLPDGTKTAALFQCFDDSMVDFDKPCRLVLTYEAKELTFAASDFFAALDGVRQQLEPSGITPIINGTNRSCYPSGMARDMGMGLSVYCLRLGVGSTMADLVKTFEDDAVSQPATVKEQQEFHRLWLESFPE